jgi:tetratricopeptide (TPR) repeat protein
MSGCIDRAHETKERITPQRALARTALWTTCATLAWLAGSTAAGQATHSASASDAGMRAHYELAYRLQGAGDAQGADREHRLFLEEALHHVANARANIGEYSRAASLYNDALELNPADADLELDATKAAMDAEDPAKAERLASDALQQHLEMSAPKRALFLRVRAEALRSLGEQEKAIEQFKAAAALDPDFDNTYALGNAYLWVGDKASGRRTFAQMLATFGDTAILHMDFGRGYAEDSFFPEAIAEFRMAIEKNSQMRGLHYSLGAAYISQSGEAAYALGEAEFRKELVIDPNDPFSYPQLGKIALARHEYQEASVDLSRATALNPENPDNYLLLAQLYSETKRVPEAIAALRKAIALTSDPSRNHYAIHAAHYQLGRLLIENGNPADGRKEMLIAEDLLGQSRNQDANTLNGKPQVQLPLETTRVPSASDKAAEAVYEKSVAPLMAGSYNNLGVHAAMAGDYAGATGWFASAAEWNPELSGVNSNWGRAAFAAQEYAAAVVPLRRVLAAHPADQDTRTQLGISFYLTGDYEGALQTLRPVAPAPDNTSPLALAYADSLVKTGDFVHGMDRLAVLEQANPSDAVVRRAVGEGLADEGNYQQAADELRSAVRFNASDGAATYALAADLIMLGETTEPENLLAELADAGSQDIRAYYQLGQLRMERGDTRGAINALEAARKIDAENGAIHFALAEAYHRNAQLPDARREASFCQSLLPESLLVRRAPERVSEKSPHGNKD